MQPAVMMPVPSCTQPVGETQVSVVQMLPSSQLAAPPPTQLPLLHTSETVHASPSSQEVLSAALGYAQLEPPAHVAPVAVWHAPGLLQALAQQVPPTHWPF
jgi:hypothetical protein